MPFRRPPKQGIAVEQNRDRIEHLESVCRVTKFVAGLALLFTIISVVAAWCTEAGGVSKVAALLGLCGLLAMLNQHRDAKLQLEKLRNET